MFLPARYTCNDKRGVCLFRSQFGECPPCGRLEGEVVQVADINKGT